jgi:two-component system, sensor histidine kinase and response regulator
MARTMQLTVMNEYASIESALPGSTDDERPDKEFAERHPLRILIADDNYINRRVLSLMLQRLGYEIVTTECGLACLDAAIKQPIDLLLIDLNMPDISGIECTRRLREAGRIFPIVAVTATSPSEGRRECLAAGMNDYLAKPLRLEDLMVVLRNASSARTS